MPLPPFDRYVRDGGYHATVSQHAMHWLAARDFDVVHFADWQGHGSATIQAKHHKQAFANTTVVLMTHGPLRWARESNEQARPSPRFSSVTKGPVVRVRRTSLFWAVCEHATSSLSH